MKIVSSYVDYGVLEVHFFVPYHDGDGLFVLIMVARAEDPPARVWYNIPQVGPFAGMGAPLARAIAIELVIGFPRSSPSRRSRSAASPLHPCSCARQSCVRSSRGRFASPTRRRASTKRLGTVRSARPTTNSASSWHGGDASPLADPTGLHGTRRAASSALEGADHASHVRPGRERKRSRLCPPLGRFGTGMLLSSARRARRGVRTSRLRVPQSPYGSAPCTCPDAGALASEMS